jgi:superfamily II RNA helicase
LIRLVGSLQSYKMEPLIVFSFSRRECEAYSLACANPDMGNLCFADAEEAAAIEEVGFVHAAGQLYSCIYTRVFVRFHCCVGFGGVQL